ncbi:MAG: 4-hydroxythreonine-4-phosphate dehydrogenase PdxA [Cellvibrionales bacterium TMED47]|nr:4-hydroxythreonine-4-phosphate dehydrogenase PdxA [Porticoccaceae bacterium]RPG84569.1 MAG: 4-hydroxythreonine-4-phosphate dehydrogenase PdxA [Cellvibrionales bacterium TMED47]|tara:strand:- start:727 stop:1722 length:996 start_codon:yes stop_codon:yes gene_type:complete
MSLRLAVTPGEPAGIGPELLIQAVQQGCDHELVAFADPDLLQQRANLLKLPLKLKIFDPHRSATPLLPGELYIKPITLSKPSFPGVLDIDNANYVLSCLDAAIDVCKDTQCAGLITGPVQKSIINDAGIAFSGHTEYLAQKTSTDTVVMMLATEKMRVALATTHLPLRKVSDAISTDLLHKVIKILSHDLKTKFALEHPKILVCGLNPHAGEGGHLGSEEMEIISPAINYFKTQGLDLIGPLPADTLFTEKHLKSADAILAMYHDQGLPVLKHSGFGRAANITLGLPIIRTSVDHGTALDLAGKGIADCGSFEVAISMATQMASLQVESID